MAFLPLPGSQPFKPQYTLTPGEHLTPSNKTYAFRRAAGEGPMCRWDMNLSGIGPVLDYGSQMVLFQRYRDGNPMRRPPGIDEERPFKSYGAVVSTPIENG